jgi:integrase
MPPDCRCGTPKPNSCPVHPGDDETIAPCGCAGTVAPRPKIHSLRHTHASWLISLGIQLEAVQDQLGHESILTTRGVYGHLLPALGAAGHAPAAIA